MSRRRMMLATMGLAEPPAPVVWRPTATISQTQAQNRPTPYNPTNFHTYVNEVSPNDANYLLIPKSGNGNVVLRLGGPAVVSIDYCLLQFRWRGYNTATVSVTLGGVTYATIALGEAGFYAQELTIPATDAANLNLADLRLTLACGGSAIGSMGVSHIQLTIIQK